MLAKIAPLGLTSRVFLTFAAGGILTVLVSAVTWLSFQRVAETQRALIDDAIPALDAAQSVAQLKIRLVHLSDRLGQAESEDQLVPLENALLTQLGKMRDLLVPQRLNQTDAPDSAGFLQAIEENVLRQSQLVRQRIALQEQERRLLALHQGAARTLAKLSETFVANAFTTTSASICTLFSQQDAQASGEARLKSVDRLIEVILDHLERMSELQLVCLTLEALLEQFEREFDATALAHLERRFATHLEVLQRRLLDIGDPVRRETGLAQFKILSSAVEPDGLFALRAQNIRLTHSLQAVRDQDAVLAAGLTDRVTALVKTAGNSIDVASDASRRAYNRGIIGFLATGGLLFLALIATLWALLRFEVFGRLRGMEQAVRDVAAGNYDIDIPVGRNGPLAPLSRAVAQFRDDARERQRLERELMRYHEELEELVASRTAELRRSNASLEQLADAHDTARREAEEANRAKAVFLANLSHELRTPLSAISGCVELLSGTRPDASQGEYIRMIGYANSTVLDIVEDMLSFSRLEAGTCEPEAIPIVIRDVIDDMLALQRVSLGTGNIALLQDIAADVPKVVLGDRGKLNQILLNLMGNAVKFTDEGSVTLSVQRLSSAPEGCVGLRFIVSDTGIGIPASKCEEAFKPFVQLRHSGHRRQQGTGLGLTICRRLVELLGGEIRLDSVLGQGTQVSFDLPFEVAEHPPVQTAVEASGGPMPQHPLEVLVVEDDEINRTVCEHHLASLGHHPIAVADGEAALELLKERREPLDAALLDISLPGLSGLEVAQRIRGSLDGRWSSLPIVVMSAHVASNTTEQVARLGAAHFLGKPFARNALARALAEAVAGGKRSTPSRDVPEADVAGQPATTRETPLLDEGFLREELASLGAKTLGNLLALFCQDTEAAISELHHHAAVNDWQSLGKRAHRLAGAAGNLGFSVVIAQARRIESAAGEAGVDKADITRMLEELGETTRRSCAALGEKLAGADSG